MTSRTGKPIVIAPYDAAWPVIFADERAMILAACGPAAFERIEHVGSTAVPGLAAKPIVDIMPGVGSLEGFAPNIAKLERLGYQYVPDFERPIPELNDPGMPFRRYFRKDVDGVRAFHLHVVEKGSDFWTKHLLFRNYLRVDETDREAYAALKRRLAEDYNATMLAKDVDINVGYTDYKSDFIEYVIAKARARAAKNTPIVVAPYDAGWPERFEQQRAIVAPAMGDLAVAIEHVGSTSVPGLAAKPTIDLAIGVHSMDKARAATEPLFTAGFARAQDNFADWRYFDVANHAPGENVHLHMVPFGGARWNRYLLFRNYLRAHPTDADAYARLKRALAAEFVRDRIGYTEAKTDFVALIVERARTAHFA